VSTFSDTKPLYARIKRDAVAFRAPARSVPAPALGRIHGSPDYASLQLDGQTINEREKAAEHHENAARAYRSAAEHHGKGDHAKGKELRGRTFSRSILAISSSIRSRPFNVVPPQCTMHARSPCYDQKTKTQRFGGCQRARKLSFFEISALPRFCRQVLKCH
jgi:hypothetical protein